MDVSSTALLLLGQAVKQVDQAAGGIRRAAAVDTKTPVLTDQADLSTEAVRLLAAKNAYQAGIALAKTADEITERTIDLLA